MSEINLKPTGEKPETKVPADLQEALEAAPLAMALWNDITPISRRDFISWIDSAKQVETRTRRIEVACSKLAAGKRRPCCYAIIPMKLYKALDANPAAKVQWKDLSPDERRDLVDWLESAPDAAANRQRIEEVCAMLAAGERRP